ncbi:DUF1778 domain-containing protein [Desulfotignum balticum]|uniref:type II toxin -antitoxin system TacA 1-like antitoxin n=1 Tax=Desulfotignum balticum TaxID=115781 RepID=UPI00338DF584
MCVSLWVNKTYHTKRNSSIFIANTRCYKFSLFIFYHRKLSQIRLNKQSAEHLFTLIENPPEPNPKLAQAMEII